DAQIGRHGKLRVVETVRKVGPVDWSLWWQDLKWVVGHRDKLARCAVVTDHGWVGAVTRAAGALFSGGKRVFSGAAGGVGRGLGGGRGRTLPDVIPANAGIWSWRDGMRFRLSPE